MPSSDIKSVLDNKNGLSFTIKTPGAKWKCQLHSDRASYEKKRVHEPVVSSEAPVLPRTDSGLSNSSAESSKSH